MKKESFDITGNNNENEVTIEMHCADFARIEPDFQTLKSARDAAKKGIIEKMDLDVFTPSKKSVALKEGVVVKRSTRVTASVDQNKVDSEWLKAFLCTDGAAAISVVIDPKILKHSDEVDALLDKVDYLENIVHSYTVSLDTVKRETK